ncbi:MAG: copper transporter [Solirubrobacterales bacterium]
MGYSARYHAASLAAVFLALAIGILIGAAFGDDVVTGTAESLERSLQGDLDEARDETDALGVELGRERDFGRQAYPAIVGARLPEVRVGLVGLGAVPDQLGANVRAALEPTGAELAAVAVVREPPDVEAIAEAGGLDSPAADPRLDAIEAYGAIVGEQIVEGGPLLERTQDELFSRVSGSLGDLDAVVVSRDRPEEMTREEELQTDSLEAGLLSGLAASPAAVVGVERTRSPTSVAVFSSQGLATVDHIDLVAGQVALILALLGAEGNYGVKQSADQLLPDVLDGPTTFGGDE